jgi:hypothetical protein
MVLTPELTDEDTSNPFGRHGADGMRLREQQEARVAPCGT